jgi:hypothetical protein
MRTAHYAFWRLLMALIGLHVFGAAYHTDHHQMASRWVPRLAALEIKAAQRSIQDTW